ncbi:MAG: CoA ester lyase, partial [Thermoplasmata archaeon]|nr:CoA ester lyase [Thermoplasmata archaeon]
YEIASASGRVEALAFGAEDYTRDVGGERSREGTELLYARSRLVMCAKAAGVQALDTVHSDLSDMEGLYESALASRRMGFDGKSAIHPRQIEVIHRAFTPSGEEVEHARRVLEAIEEARRRGSGVAALGRKMIDRPVVERAERVLMIMEKVGARTEGKKEEGEK